jgi:hypothetical protein
MLEIISRPSLIDDNRSTRWADGSKHAFQVTVERYCVVRGGFKDIGYQVEIVEGSYSAPVNRWERACASETIAELYIADVIMGQCKENE